MLELDPAYADALQGIEAGAEVVLLTWLHQADRGVLRTHPRGEAWRPIAGVFATRSPDRPNPIGLHHVRVVAVDGCRVTVDALEAIDGTPLVDIKPEIR